MKNVLPLPEDILRELTVFAGRRIQMEISGQQLFQLLAVIQLACRHPNFSGPTRITIEKFARNLQKIARIEAPELQVLHQTMEAGWHHENDVPHL